MTTKDASERLAKLRSILQESPDSPLFAEFAGRLLELGNFRDAEAICRAGLTFHPNHLGGKRTLANALERQGAIEEAIALLEGVAQGQAVPPGVWRDLERLHRQVGNEARAQECTEKVASEQSVPKVGQDGAVPQVFRTKAMAAVLRLQGKERLAKQIERDLDRKDEK